MNLANINGKATYVHRVGSQRLPVKRAQRLEEEFRSAIVEAENEGRVQRPRGGPIPMVCKCGRIFAGGGRRQMCFECYDEYKRTGHFEHITCGGCGKTVVSRNPNQKTCGAPICQRWRDAINRKP